MANLSNILKTKGQQLVAERGTGIEKGKIFVFTPGNQNLASDDAFCWQAPGAGTVVVEAWGASGSGARMCCCGAGIPGNPGAYSKKTLTVSEGSFVCGSIGLSCCDLGNGEADLCFRGCSQPTEICYSATETGCICAMGGRGGFSLCTTDNGTSSPYCCFVECGYSHTVFDNSKCGLICNYDESEDWIAYAYGGDINCKGGFSCTSFYCQCGTRPCAYTQHIATSPGIYSLDGAVVSFSADQDNGMHDWSGGFLPQLQYAVNAISRRPNQGTHFYSCWAVTSACGCYDFHGRTPYVPYGIPGTPPSPCSGMRDHAAMGGHGAVRIKFIGSS